MLSFFRRIFGALPLLSLFIAWPAVAIDESELLPVDEAYALSAEASGTDEVRIRWKIADGYYLYRHRTSAAPASAAVRSGALRLPRGVAHEDEFFGKTETYRDELVATLPEIAGAGDTLSLKIKYQGCADAGICYPPQTRTLSVRMPGAAKSAGFDPLARVGAGPLGDLLGTGGKAAPLPEQRAFGFEAIAGDGNTLLLRFTPAPGYYLYRDRSAFVLEADGVSAGTPRWPKGATHRDEHFGDVIVYFDPVDLTLPLIRTKPDGQTVTLRATFQGCQNDGICYPPMTRSVQIALPRGEVRAPAASGDGPTTVAVAIPGSGDDTADAPATGRPAPEASTDIATVPAPTPTPAPTRRDVDADADTGTRDSLTLLSALLFALLGGLILNLMPCVLPVLSIKVLGLIENNESPQRARSHALWYAAGVLLSFVALGAAVLALRHLGQALGWGFQLQKPGVVSFLGLVMFAFGLSLSGVWHVGGRWTGVGHGLASRSGPAGDFFTGVLAVVVAAPCTAPFMAPALGWAFAASPVSALLVFACLGLGLALPFLLVGFMPALARMLPKPGAWMETLKQILAFPLYLTAAWLVWVLTKQRGADAFGWWAIAAIAVAFAAWAWTHARMRGTRWGRIAAVLALLSVPWLLWTISTLPASDAAQARSPTASDAVPFSEQRLADLRKADRVVLVNMTADWCVTCKANEKTVFAREGFREALAAADGVYMVGDWTDVDPAITAYLQRYKAVGVPLYVVYPRGGGDGEVLPTVLTPQLVREALTSAAAK